MKQVKKLIGFSFIFSLLFVACRKDSPLVPETNNMSEETEADASARGLHGDNHENARGFVYTLSNQADGNKVLVYRRASNGMLSWQTAYSTGGNGSGGGLGNQGAIILGSLDNHHYGHKDENNKTILLAVNAGSNSISSFTVTSYGLRLRSTVPSGGTKPISITQHGHVVYVLNAGGEGNISGFWLGYGGRLYPIPHSTRPLSSMASDPAQIQFVNNGKVLVVTEKATNKIITYTVNRWGIPGDMHSLTSANTTPFGFDAGRHGNIIVSEAGGGAPGASTLSSYRIGNDGSISLIDGPDGAGQTAACWVVITKNRKYAYTTNTGSNNISTFAIENPSGNISVYEAIAATTPAGPIDAALSRNSKFLYVLNSGGNSISGFSIGGNGGLTPIQTVEGLPDSANGLAAE